MLLVGGEEAEDVEEINDFAMLGHALVNAIRSTRPRRSVNRVNKVNKVKSIISSTAATLLVGNILRVKMTHCFFIFLPDTKE